MRKKIKTKIKKGKISRHKFKKKLGVKAGFGKPWFAPFVTFRVEFSFEDEKGNTSNEQIHWIECRKLSGEEYRSARTYFDNKHGEWRDRETIESKYVFAYVCKFLNDKAEELGINQAFVFFTSCAGNETIRMPVYQITLEQVRKEDLRDIYCDSAEVTLKKTIWHHN